MPPSSKLYFEDMPLDTPTPLGTYHVTKEEIIEFATEFDPQLIHIDEVAAKDSIVGGLCASGFHSCSMIMRMLCDGLLLTAESRGSPGLNEVKWKRPVRPGDSLSTTYTCTAKRALSSRPDMGVCTITIDMTNQDGDLVLQMCDVAIMFGRRDTAGGAA